MSQSLPDTKCWNWTTDLYICGCRHGHWLTSHRLASSTAPFSDGF